MSTTTNKRPKRHHADEYKKEAIKLSERVGVAKAARQLDLGESLLYTSRHKNPAPGALFYAPGTHQESSIYDKFC